MSSAPETTIHWLDRRHYDQEAAGHGVLRAVSRGDAAMARLYVLDWQAARDGYPTDDELRAATEASRLMFGRRTVLLQPATT